MERKMLDECRDWGRGRRRGPGWVPAVVAAIGIWGSWSGASEGAAEPGGLDEPVPMWRLPEAAAVMADVLAGFPDVPMQIVATIRTRKPGGPVERTVNADVFIRMRDGVYSADYAMTDAFGGSPEQLSVERIPGQPPRYRYRIGDPPRDAEPPGLTERVKETDLTWLDLGLSYLWWPNGKTTGTERIRGRSCYVIEIPAPAGEAAAFAFVRLWIDPKINMLLQAESCTAAGERTRRLTIESFKKVDGVWFFKDIDLVTYPERSRTTLRVQELRAMAAAPEDETKPEPAAVD